jgi:hypothetical protein
MGKTRMVRRRPKAAGAVYNGENAIGAEAAEGRRSCLQWWKRGWCGGGRRPPELFTMGKREWCEDGRRPPELFTMGKTLMVRWDRAVFTMVLDARLSVKCAFLAHSGTGNKSHRSVTFRALNFSIVHIPQRPERPLVEL